MNYISAEQFLKADKDVQKAILEWWDPEIGDLIESNGKYCVIDTFVNAINCCSVNLYNDGNKTFNKTDVIPLLTEGQLREFIEEKLDGCNIYFESYTNENSILTVEFEYNHSIEGDCNVGEYKVNCEDMLDGYWNIACRLAKEE